MDRNLLLLFAANLAVALSTSLIQPFFPLYLRSLSASEAEIGLVIALSNIAATALMFPSGLLIRRLGKKRLLMISAILSAVSPLLLAAVGDLRLITPFSMIYNAAFSFFMPARMVLIAEGATSDNRGFLFGFMNIAMPLGGIVGPFVSGLIVENVGWTWAFLSSAAMGLAMLVPCALIREPATTPTEIRTEERKAKLSDRQYFRWMALLFVFHIIETIGLGAVNLVLPLFLQEEYGLSYSLVGLFFTGSNILTVITQMPSGYIADRYGIRNILVACFGAIAVIFGIWNFFDDWSILLVLYVAASGLWSVTWPSTVSLLADLVPAELMGSTFGIRMTGVRLGFTLGPMLAGYLYGGYGYSAVFPLAALLYASGTPLAILLAKGTRRRPQQAARPYDN